MKMIRLESRRFRLSRSFLISITILLLGIGSYFLWIGFRKVHQDSLCTSLWSAVGEGNVQEVRDCLAEGADANCEHGSLIRRARMGDHEDIVEILKQAGAKESATP